MRILFSFLICLFTLQTSAQSERVTVKGTAISLVPPAKFIAATKFSGFQLEASGSSIMVTELPGSLEQHAASFTAEGLKAKGMTLIEKKDVLLDGAKALYIKLTQLAGGTTYHKQMLLFGDDKKCFIINGIYPDRAKALEGAINKSLFTAKYDATLVVDPLASITFSIDVTNTPFKFAKTISGSIVYTLDGLVPTKSPAKENIVVSGSLGGVVSGNRQQFAIERLHKLPGGQDLVVRETKPITIDGKEGVEIIATGKDGSRDGRLTYEVMLFKPNGEYLIIVASTDTKAEQYLPVFKGIAKTFKEK